MTSNQYLLEEYAKEAAQTGYNAFQKRRKLTRVSSVQSAGYEGRRNLSQEQDIERAALEQMADDFMRRKKPSDPRKPKKKRGKKPHRESFEARNERAIALAWEEREKVRVAAGRYWLTELECGIVNGVLGKRHKDAPEPIPYCELPCQGSHHACNQRRHHQPGYLSHHPARHPAGVLQDQGQPDPPDLQGYGEGPET